MFKEFVQGKLSSIIEGSEYGIKQKQTIEDLEDEKNSLVTEQFKAEQEKNDLRKEIENLSNQIGFKYSKDNFENDIEIAIKKAKLYIKDIDESYVDNICEMVKDIKN